MHDSLNDAIMHCEGYELRAALFAAGKWRRPMRKYSVVGTVMVDHGTHHGEQIETAEFRARNGLNAMRRACRGWNRFGRVTAVSVTPLTEQRKRGK